MEYRVEFKLAINNKEAIGLKMNHLTAEKLPDAKRRIEAIIAQHYTEPKLYEPCQPTQPNTSTPQNPMEAVKVPTTSTAYKATPLSSPTPAGTKGLIFVHCSSCGVRFVTFAKEPVTEHICKCGHKIDLDPCKLAHFEFVCPDCGKLTYGYTNNESAGFWKNCICGKKVELEWRNKTKSYIGKAE